MRTVTVIVVAAASLLLAACGGGSHPSQAACKQAMKQQYATALASGQQGTEPAACKGLSSAVLTRLAGQVLAGQ